MSTKIIIIRYGEIHLKGNNRRFFENLLLDNIKASLKEFKFELIVQSGRYILNNLNQEQIDSILYALSSVSGIHSYSVATQTSANIDEIFNAAKPFFENVSNKTFKVETNRADKSFPLTSIEISREIGAKILQFNSQLSVEIKSPDITLKIDLRENNIAFVFSDIIMGLGGMPVGCAGNGLLLLSGGIDSPVAGFLMAKRGMKVSSIHFHSYPYTSIQAKDKVVALAGKLSKYTNGMRLYFVKFTNIQEQIHKNCPPEMMVTLMRRFMMRIAEKIAVKNKMQCLITGESLGQVASQTIEGLTSTEDVVEKLPILRPLIAYDKLDIVKISEKIDTYDISIQPYEDCCTIFLPKHPLIKPRLESVYAAESHLDIQTLVENAVNEVEIIKL